jgi:hypothetical protein
MTKDAHHSAASSGVYRAGRAEDVLSAAEGLRVAQLDLAGVRDKATLLQAVARVLEFPSWFGGNWDALEDCLTDLSWHGAEGHVLLIEGVSELPRDDLGVFRDVLASAAEYWAGCGRRFFAVFVGGDASLPEFGARQAR